MEKQEAGPEKLHDVANLDDSQNLSDGAMNLVSKDPAGVFTAPESGDTVSPFAILIWDILSAIRSRFR